MTVNFIKRKSWRLWLLRMLGRPEIVVRTTPTMITVLLSERTTALQVIVALKKRGVKAEGAPPRLPPLKCQECCHCPHDCKRGYSIGPCEAYCGIPHYHSRAEVR